MVHRQVELMGSYFDISLVDQDTSIGNIHIDEIIAEISRIEHLISEWIPNSQVSQVNANAGIKAVVVDRELFALTQRALYYSRLSAGAFDISIAAMDKIWKFDGSMTAMPSASALARSVAAVGYENIILDSVACTIFLKHPGMKIGFGSIGKGYAADRGRILMEQKDVRAGMVNAAGDIACWGKPLNHRRWTIGVSNPFKPYEAARIIKLKHGGVTTSGSYTKFAEIDDIRYAHIINPKTGMPSTGLTSVTVYGPSAEFANALSTSIMVLGHHEGLKLIQKHPSYRYVFITDNGTIIP